MRRFLLLFAAAWLLAVGAPACSTQAVMPPPELPLPPQPTPVPTVPPGFQGEAAFALVEEQVLLGPRVPGEAGHGVFLDWVQAKFESFGWDTALQKTSISDYPVTNVIATREVGQKASGWVIIAAHYDTRRYSDRDPDPQNRDLPVPGANDGGSGVAVILELARVLPDLEDQEVWFVLFDQEDGGDIEGQPWILGSTAFVRDLPLLAGSRLPDAVVVVDMVGDTDLNIHIELNSTPALVDEIWGTAESLGYGDSILPSRKYSMIDDHRPFLQAGIPAAVLIDFDYEFWHTRSDTPENVSAASLQAVGETLFYWLVP